MAWLAAGVVAAAVVEITVFVLVARRLGVPLAVLLAAGTSVVGVLLLRREGVRAWRRFRAAVDSGEPPGTRVVDGLVGLIGALLLAAPGLVTDVLGALLLVPPVRPLAGRGVRRVAEGRLPSTVAGDVFGPRRVRARVRRGRRGSAGPAAAGDPGVLSGPAGPAAGTGPGGRWPGTGAAADTDAPAPGPVVEGEIVDPGDPR